MTQVYILHENQIETVKAATFPIENTVLNCFSETQKTLFCEFVRALVCSIYCRRNPDLPPPLDQRHHVSVRPVPRKNEVKTRGGGGGGGGQ